MKWKWKTIVKLKQMCAAFAHSAVPPFCRAPRSPAQRSAATLWSVSAYLGNVCHIHWTANSWILTFSYARSERRTKRRAGGMQARRCVAWDVDWKSRRLKETLLLGRFFTFWLLCFTFVVQIFLRLLNVALNSCSVLLAPFGAYRRRLRHQKQKFTASQAEFCVSIWFWCLRIRKTPLFCCKLLYLFWRFLRFYR